MTQQGAAAVVRAAFHLLLLQANRGAANMYDVLEPAKVPPASCRLGCARWGQLKADAVSFAGSAIRNQSAANMLWASGGPPAGYSGCAQPGSSMGTPLPDDPNSNVGWGGWMGRDGSWCWCKNGSSSSPLINVAVLGQVRHCLYLVCSTAFVAKTVPCGLPVQRFGLRAAVEPGTAVW